MMAKGATISFLINIVCTYSYLACRVHHRSSARTASVWFREFVLMRLCYLLLTNKQFISLHGMIQTLGMANATQQTPDFQTTSISQISDTKAKKKKWTPANDLTVFTHCAGRTFLMDASWTVMPYLSFFPCSLM